MAEFYNQDKNKILDIDDEDKDYINTVLKPLLEKNLMEKVRKKIIEDRKWGVQLFLLVALGEDQYFFNSKKILNEEFKDYRLVSFTIPNTITTIGERAFSGTRLESIEIPDSVTKIGDRAFWGMNMSTIKIPKRLKSRMKDIFTPMCLENSIILYT